MGVEEQQEEREVLDSIFPDEIVDLGPTEFRVSIALDVVNQADDTSEPHDYPNEGPRLDISAPQNAPKHRYFDVQEDKESLLRSLGPTIEENLEQLIADRQGAAEVAREKEARKAEEEENRKFQGEAVTRESFLAWRTKFIQELEDERKRIAEEKELEDKKKRVAKDEKKMTGRELWERGLAGKVEEDDLPEDILDVEKLKLDSQAE